MARLLVRMHVPLPAVHAPGPFIAVGLWCNTCTRSALPAGVYLERQLRQRLHSLTPNSYTPFQTTPPTCLPMRSHAPLVAVPQAQPQRALCDSVRRWRVSTHECCGGLLVFALPVVARVEDVCRMRRQMAADGSHGCCMEHIMSVLDRTKAKRPACGSIPCWAAKLQSYSLMLTCCRRWLLRPNA